MPYTLNDNPMLKAPKVLDARYGPWESAEQALKVVKGFMRQKGLTVGVIGPQDRVVEYWWEDGIQDHQLVPKATDGDKTLTFHVTHMDEVVIEHGMGKHPSVQVFDQDHKACITNIEHIDENNTRVAWLEPFTGKVTLN